MDNKKNIPKVEKLNILSTHDFKKVEGELRFSKPSRFLPNYMLNNKKYAKSERAQSAHHDFEEIIVDIPL